MTRLILNLGIDGPTHGVSTMSRLDRAFAYSVAVPKLMERGAATWERQGDTFIVMGTTKHAIGERELVALANCAEQDCIAVWFPDFNHGFLYGPKAAEWGAFDKAFFVMPTPMPVMV